MALQVGVEYPSVASITNLVKVLYTSTSSLTNPTEIIQKTTREIRLIRV